MGRYKVTIIVECAELDYGIFGKVKCTEKNIKEIIRTLLNAATFARPKGLMIHVK